LHYLLEEYDAFLANHSCPFGNNCNHARRCLASELSTQEAVHALAVILTEAGEATFNKSGKLPTPQILFGIGGTHAYGSCQSASGSIQIPGSFYCAKTNTILLEYQQLEELRRSFGDGAIVYALAHEYAHYIQDNHGHQNKLNNHARTSGRLHSWGVTKGLTLS
jgi:predicted metalloprotease